jgi:hypothetical protein
MNTYLQTAVVNEALIESCDTKFAIWTSLLPSCKKDPLGVSGQIDEVMYVKKSQTAGSETLLIPLFRQVYGAYVCRYVSVHQPFSESKFTCS